MSTNMSRNPVVREAQKLRARRGQPRGIFAQRGHQPRPVPGGQHPHPVGAREGGMGVVFECTHLVLGNRVVIKVLKSSSGVDAEVRARFLREGRAAALLESPHIVRVLDAGTLESGEPFLCMEKLRGHDLARELVVEIGRERCLRQFAGSWLVRVSVRGRLHGVFLSLPPSTVWCVIRARPIEAARGSRRC